MIADLEAVIELVRNLHSTAARIVADGRLRQ